MSGAINRLITAVSDNLPKTNKFVLEEFPEKKMDDLVTDIETVLKEAVQTVPGALDYKDYEILDPYKRAIFDMKINRGTTTKPEIPTAVSEWRLVKYNFIHNSMDGRNEVSLHLYVPYMVNGFLVINNKKMVVRKGISETVFSRMDEKGFRGYLVRFARVKLKFEMDVIQPLHSMRDPRKVYGHEFVTRAQIYTGKSTGRPKAYTTDFLYILAEFGLEETLRKVGVDPREITFTQTIDDDEDYDYFLAKEPNNGPPIYMRVRKSYIVAKDKEEENSHQFKMQRKTVSNLVYLLSKFSFQRINEIYDPRGLIWKTMIGKIISPKKSDVEARADAENHFSSARGFVDPMGRERAARFGFPHIKNLYDLLLHLYININEMMANTVPQNLYEKRIDIKDALIVDIFAIPINKQFYTGHGKANLKENDVRAIFNIRADLFTLVKNSSKSGVEIVDANPSITTDNWLTSCGIMKVRHGGHARERFHPSIPIVESVNSLVGKESGRTGMLNPFVEVDLDGKILKPEWAKELDLIKNFLPHN